jgi:hypothetical protein
MVESFEMLLGTARSMQNKRITVKSIETGPLKINPKSNTRQK